MWRIAVATLLTGLLAAAPPAHAGGGPAALADVARSASAIATPLAGAATPPWGRSAMSRPTPPRRARTVRGAIRRAWLAGHISRARHDRLRRDWRDAERLAARLPGRRRAELMGVMRDVADLARRGRLTPGRLALAMLTLRRNAFAWARLPLPAPRERRTFGRDPLIFQHYPGHGWQVQHLATAGRANALAKVCLHRRAGRRARSRCRPAALRSVVSRLTDVAVRRGSFTAWEHPFAFGGARPGWISGMTQATAVQALVRAASALRDPRLRDVARDALRAFERRTPVGVAVPTASGRFYALYSDLPQLHVVNAHLQALIGLREAAQRGLSVRAGRAYRRGAGAARPAIRAADTGAWSLYATGGRESDLGYHRLVRGFLRTLCRETRRVMYCAPHTRFARYEREPPLVRLTSPRRARAGRPAAVAFTLSKVSTVRVRVVGRRGPALDARIRLPRGGHTFRWTPPRRGRYTVAVSAAGLSGPRSVTTTVVRALKPRR